MIILAILSDITDGGDGGDIGLGADDITPNLPEPIDLGNYGT
jgi:hypothetical protein